MVMRDMLVTVVAGLGAGVGLALPLGLALEPALFEVSTTDAVSFVAAALLLAAVAGAATYLPARRAAALDPPAP